MTLSAENFYILEAIIGLETLYWWFSNFRFTWKACKCRLLLFSFQIEKSEEEPETRLSKLIYPEIHFSFFLKDLAIVSLLV